MRKGYMLVIDRQQVPMFDNTSILSSRIIVHGRRLMSAETAQLHLPPPPSSPTDPKRGGNTHKWVVTSYDNVQLLS